MYCLAWWWMRAYSGERWLISSTDTPLPPKFSSSCCAARNASTGSVAGPAPKFTLRCSSPTILSVATWGIEEIQGRVLTRLQRHNYLIDGLWTLG